MKTSILRSVTLLPILVLAGMACAIGPVPKANVNNPAALEHELQHQIDKLVIYPLMERTGTMDGDVVVSLVVDEQGQVKVTGAQSNNPALQAYVLKKLAKVDVGTNPGGVWRTSHFRFRFHPES